MGALATALAGAREQVYGISGDPATAGQWPSQTDPDTHSTPKHAIPKEAAP
jgi:hypothetical protein